MGFAEQIKAFEQKAILKASLNTNNIVEELFSQVVILSPSPSNPGLFFKGLLANQWYSEVGSYSNSLSTTTNDSGLESLSRIKATLRTNPFLGKDNIITFTNNVNHAYRAENLGWPQGEGANGWYWSGKQAPYGMVNKSVLIIKAKY